jgi:hypothetical protein
MSFNLRELIEEHRPVHTPPFQPGDFTAAESGGRPSAELSQSAEPLPVRKRRAREEARQKSRLRQWRRVMHVASFDSRAVSQ